MREGKYKVYSEYSTEEYQEEDLRNIDISHISDNSYHIIQNNNSHLCDILNFDPQNKKMLVSVSGTKIRVSIEDEYDMLIENMGYKTEELALSSNILAPMPGLVVNLMVKEGDEVSKNTSLIIIEAMKMENVLKASGDGTIKAIKIKIGDTVEKDQILIEID